MSSFAAPLASTMSEGVRTALLALLGLLVVIFGCLIAFAFVIRSRHGAAVVENPRDPESADDGADDPDKGRAEAIRDPMVCPACRREFDSHLRYCPHDATRLIPAPQVLARLAQRRRSVRVCPRCRSTYSGAMRFCPQDGNELLPIAAYKRARSAGSAHEHEHEHSHEHEHEHKHSHEPTAGHEHTDDADGEIGKICPECRGRYRYGASFCGKDGVELVVLN